MRPEIPPDILDLFFEATPDHLERAAQIKGLEEYLDELHRKNRQQYAEDHLERTRKALKLEALEMQRTKRLAKFKLISTTLGAFVTVAGAAGKILAAIFITHNPFG